MISRCQGAHVDWSRAAGLTKDCEHLVNQLCSVASNGSTNRSLTQEKIKQVRCWGTVRTGQPAEQRQVDGRRGTGQSSNCRWSRILWRTRCGKPQDAPVFAALPAVFSCRGTTGWRNGRTSPDGSTDGANGRRKRLGTAKDDGRIGKINGQQGDGTEAGIPVVRTPKRRRAQRLLKLP